LAAGAREDCVRGVRHDFRLATVAHDFFAAQQVHDGGGGNGGGGRREGGGGY